MASDALPEVKGYTIERLIDTGGFSRVYRATQHGLDRPVAIKVLNSSFEDNLQQKTFERECKLMGQLSTHQNIVTVFASGVTSSSQPCIIMELYEGTFRADDELDIASVLDVGAKVADALQTIHDQGIAHRDIKPHNVFISEHGQPAIGDFGISSIENERTVTGGAGFSINYAPPEVFEEGGAGAPGDIYSLGATLYQLASGEVPYPHSGESSERLRSTVHKIMTAPPPTLRRSDAPEALDRLLRRCMAKEVGDRPASPSAVANELRQIQAEMGQLGQTSQSQTFINRPSNRGDGGTDSTVVRESEDEFATRNLTVVRSRQDAKELPLRDTPSEPAESEPGDNRNLLIGLSVAGAVVVISGLFILLGIGSAGEDGTTTSVATTSAAAVEFVILTPPDSLSVQQLDDGSFNIGWSDSQDDVKYQIHLVGSSENRYTEDLTYNWTIDDDSTAACFEVRTVDADETSVSQSAAGPVCG